MASSILKKQRQMSSLVAVAGSVQTTVGLSAREPVIVREPVRGARSYISTTGAVSHSGV